LLFTSQILIGDEDRRADLIKHFSELGFDYWSKVLESEIEEMRVQAQGAEDSTPDPDRVDSDQDTGRLRAVDTPPALPAPAATEQ
jgi:hypothetical protein